MQRAEIVRQGAAQLFVAENALDATLCEVANLSSLLVQMRMNAKLSAVVGQDVIGGLAATYASLSEARGTLVEVHKNLDLIKTQMGCRTVMTGTDGDKPGTQPSGRYIEVVGNGEQAA